MDDFESRLNSILSSPDSLEKIKQLAQSFASGESSEEETAEKESPMRDLSALLGGVMGDWEKPSETEKIMSALQPYLSGERSKRLDRAIKFARIYKVAKRFLPELGGKNNDESL